ncbi:MAG: uroporphyrinogen-III synthase [Halobacteria archaeon]
MARPAILLLRPRDRLRAGRRLCASLGLRAVAAPALEPRVLKRPRLGPAEIAVFTSRRAAEALDRRALAPLRRAEIWGIGPDTARALRERGLRPRVPPVHSSAGLLRSLRPRVRGRRVLLLRSRQGDPALPRGLSAAGGSVRDAPLYTLERPRDSAALRRAVRESAAGRVEIFAFTSAGTADSFLDAAREAGLELPVSRAMARGVVAAMGQPTRRVLRSRGVRVDFVPPRADFEALVRGARDLLFETLQKGPKS